MRKFGNSLGVVLPKEVIQRLRTADGERVFRIEAGGGDYRLTPYDPTFEKKMSKAEKSWAVTATVCTLWQSERRQEK